MKNGTLIFQSGYTSQSTGQYLHNTDPTEAMEMSETGGGNNIPEWNSLNDNQKIIVILTGIKKAKKQGKPTVDITRLFNNSTFASSYNIEYQQNSNKLKTKNTRLIRIFAKSKKKIHLIINFVV